MPVQLLTLVVVPSVVAAVARSLGAGVQTILWGFVFSTVALFPIYMLEAVRRHHADGGLYLDGDGDLSATIGTNLADAVLWLVLLTPSLLIPLGILSSTMTSATSSARTRHAASSPSRTR